MRKIFWISLSTHLLVDSFNGPSTNDQTPLYYDEIEEALADVKYWRLQGYPCAAVEVAYKLPL